MALSSAFRDALFDRVPLCYVPGHYAQETASPMLREYLSTVLRLCPAGARTCDVATGTGYAPAWLSLRGAAAEGLDPSPRLVERARQVGSTLGAPARYRVGDPFRLYEPGGQRWHVLHHQGLLHRFAVPQIHALLAQQVAAAGWVVFSVPSAYAPGDGELGDERLLPLEEWQRILQPFDVEELRCYGGEGGREHILGVLRGRPADDALRALMVVPEEPYPPGISAIVHTRNEAHQLADCLETLKGWADEIIVCDMESSDATVEVAGRTTDLIVAHPLIRNFDRARNVSAMRARFRWVFFVDADERIPPGLAQALRGIADRDERSFDALMLPFKHYFSGKWLQCLYPGYTSARFLRNGCFHFNTRLHAGVSVAGASAFFPANDPNLAVVHLSYPSITHYLEKMNRYTDGEAANMHEDGKPFHWQNALAHFANDLRAYYDGYGAGRDGIHGLIYAFQSAFYRFEQHAKLYERRFQEGKLQPGEDVVPASAEEILAFALGVLREQPRPAPAPIRVADEPGAARVVWSGPLFDPSGYGEESRHLLLAAAEAGVPVAAHIAPWGAEEAALPPAVRGRLQELAQRPAVPGFIQVLHNFPSHFQRHPQAGFAIGRTMFETDRLPQEWVDRCNRMDAVWVPSEFNCRSFAGAGVERHKLVAIPGSLDAEPYRRPAERVPAVAEAVGEGRFVFLSVFDWTLHKGWDVLLRAFLEAFEGKEDVLLLLKVWSTMGYSPEQIPQQAAEFAQRELGHELLQDPRIRFLQAKLDTEAMAGLYQAAGAFVLPSRGEGWGRPYMEAMACGVPAIGTAWSGNTAFMTPENSYLLDCEVVPVTEAGWREIPTYRGHRWAEPDRAQLVQVLRRVREERGETEQIARRGQEDVCTRFSPCVVGQIVKAELERIEESRRPHPAVLPAKASSARRPSRVRWEGAQFSWHSLAHVNREFCLGLAGDEGVELSVLPTEPAHFPADEHPRFRPLVERAFAPFSGPADVHVRHFFPPRLDPCDEGALVLMQPWEYGYLPTEWLEGIHKHVREVWCYSEYVRQVYLASGVPEAKLRVVPLGVDTSVFHPGAPPYVFTQEAGASSLARLREPFFFLYLGGTLHRKGIDILLEAYLKAFSAYDDVCLVIKDTGTQTVYFGQNERERILALAADPTRPAIVYLDQDLSPAQLAGIYTACDCLALPYRGEGFCLPALEGMACGRPAIVPQGGPTDDFVDESVGWRVPAARMPFSERIGQWECAGPTWMFEVAPHDLGRAMRAALCSREEVAARGAAAAARVREGWTWAHSVAAALKRIHALQGQHPAHGSRPAAHKAAAPARSKAPAPDETRKPPRISLCMIARNEERVLAACLKSIQPWVDEIIFVDTGSTDRTVEIAESFGAKVFHFPWCDDFSAARNESLRHATGDWIFWMDADDTITEESGRKLRELATLAEERVTGFLVQVHIPPAPGDTGMTVVDHIKLFRNLPEVRFERRIHEQILEAIYRVGGQVQRSDAYVVHSGYDHTPEGQQRKRERDMHLLALEIAERPGDPFTLFNIGMTAFHLRQFDEAIAALEQCRAAGTPRESTMRKVYAMLAGSHLEKGDRQRARELVDAGLKLYPRDPELLFRAGIICREVGDLPAAERSYALLLSGHETGHIDSLDVTMTTYKARHNLALVYQDMDRLPQAEEQFRAAVAAHPHFVPSWLGLAELYLRQRRLEDVRAIIAKLEEFAPAEAQQLRTRAGL